MQTDRVRLFFKNIGNSSAKVSKLLPTVLIENPEEPWRLEHKLAVQQ